MHVPNYGVIDLGSNSIRMVIYEVADDKRKTYTSKDFCRLTNNKVMAGLAAYVEEGRFVEDGVKRASEVLRTHFKRAQYFSCKRLDVFATAVLRNATNCDEAVYDIEKASGLTINLLSARAESHLGFVGANCTKPLGDGTLIDIGGGSTELTRVKDGRDEENRSLPIGSLSSFAAFVGGVIPTAQEADAITGAVQGQLAKLPKIDVYQSKVLFGTGGTVRAVAKMLARMPGTRQNRGKDMKTVTAEDAAAVLALHTSNPSVYAHTLLKAAAERVHTLTPGCLILNELFSELGAARLEICKYGVREGYLIERMLQA